MARDDMHVIIYKILSYLYDILKKGTEVDTELLTNKNFLEIEIPYSYWREILSELKRVGYIRGVSITNGRISSINKIKITFEGVEYLHSDVFLQKVAKELNE